LLHADEILHVLSVSADEVGYRPIAPVEPFVAQQDADFILVRSPVLARSDTLALRRRTAHASTSSLRCSLSGRRSLTPGRPIGEQLRLGVGR